jgi:integrase
LEVCDLRFNCFSIDLIVALMQSHIVPTRPKSQPKSNPEWRKVPHSVGLYQYVANGGYHARVCRGGKLHWKSLQTKDLAFAKRALADFRQRLERTDSRYGKTSLLEWLEKHYWPTLKGSPSTLAEKRRVIQRVKEHWVAARTQPMRDIRQSQVLSFLNEHYGQWSACYWNFALQLIRNAFVAAIEDRVVMENAAVGIKPRKGKRPIRLTPSWQEFQAIVVDVRSQPFNRDADDSGDFLEAMGLLGLGQAELASMKREHVDLASGRILVYRHKTATPFTIPVYPQARSLIERLCKGKKAGDRLFVIDQARKALAGACERLGLVSYTQRSLRRCFITRCLELGIDVKVIAEFQGHRDGGKLILDTYSHVRPEHAHRMAALLTTDEPGNVVPMTAQSG